jgi:hypothetical protein
VNAAELTKALYDAKLEMDAAFVAYSQAIANDAGADDAARRAKARAYLTTREQLGGKATVSAIEAAVDLETADAQKAARMAEGLKRAAGMNVDAKKQWMSALQSLASLTKAEAQIAAWEPREVSA